MFIFGVIGWKVDFWYMDCELFVRVELGGFEEVWLWLVEFCIEGRGVLDWFVKVRFFCVIGFIFILKK